MIRMVLTGLEQLEIRDMEESELIPGPDEVGVDVLACAVCRTDAKMWEQGHRDLLFPRVLGHEMVVRDREGRLCTVWPGKSCGECRYCLMGRENLCEDMKITGFHNDGAFAHRILVPEKSLIPLPRNMDPVTACFAEPVGCVVNAFEKLPAEPGARVLIFGGGTMGLITALYAKSLGLNPLIIEKHEDKISRVSSFVSAWEIPLVKETHESRFQIVINACPDFIAFCQAITKVDKASHISFFSGISKNEEIETNLLNLVHYKEAVVSGAYGMKKSDMEKALPFIRNHEKELRLLVEEILPPESAPGLMPKVLSGKYLKYVLDFSGELTGSSRPLSAEPSSPAVPAPKAQDTGKGSLPGRIRKQLPQTGLLARTLAGIHPLSRDLVSRAVAKMDNKTKPLGALGRLEDLGIRMSLIQNRLTPEIRQKNIFVFAGDHGITEEGVSAYPAEVTGQMVENFLNGGAAINVLCRHHNIDMKVVDMGVIKEFSPHPDLIRAKVAKGTRNFALQDAMTREELILALESGMKIFLEAHAAKPVDIVGLGEMGIGNTTSASAMISVITGISPARAAGRGTGVDNKGLEHKIEVIEKVLNFHCPDPGDGFQILQKIGGFEIAGIAGAALAAASKGCAVVLDGVISTAAGLAALLIHPDIQGYLISGHKSVEKAQEAALAHMDLTPVIDFDMRLGEGTGAALAMDAAEAACKIMTQMASFEEARISRSTPR
ncbi:nicotinate-nucleotide--dimethylbenzimidazole phosphoribosyltransferase [Desulfospira joergensenii]|uniref:nicotinate-nucleotide--dimethylbenzimidazole phosphoribosyltransferase n=1 Tax=Desulfospira joergensenii TaxID=53329 RepID=UPI0003B72D85|nr:nicotinate-nucleotide--dimethylbenzimidazole phosphoribosyltransferase [Desulfospira joergensenii]